MRTFEPGTDSRTPGRNAVFKTIRGGSVWVSGLVLLVLAVIPVLVQQLTERIASQEARIITVEAGLDAEREARRKAEDKVHALEIDNLLLRAELRRHGIDVAAALTPDYALRTAGQP